MSFSSSAEWEQSAALLFWTLCYLHTLSDSFAVSFLGERGEKMGSPCQGGGGKSLLLLLYEKNFGYFVVMNKFRILLQLQWQSQAQPWGRPPRDLVFSGY